MTAARVREILDVVDRLRSGDLDSHVPPDPADSADGCLRAFAESVEQLGSVVRAYRDAYEIATRIRQQNVDALDGTTRSLVATIREMALPVLEVQGVLLVPVVGLFDERRAAELTDDLLARIKLRSARCAVVDLTSIREIDAGAAERLFRLHRAAALLGAAVAFSGLQPAVVRSLSERGLDRLQWPPTFGTCDQALVHFLGAGGRSTLR